MDRLDEVVGTACADASMTPGVGVFVRASRRLIRLGRPSTPSRGCENRPKIGMFVSNTSTWGFIFRSLYF